MLIEQIRSGIRVHWHIRLSEWLMLFPAVGMGTALAVIQPQMFSTAKSFAVVSQMSGESVWAAWLLFQAACRLVALVINGTFDRFPYSPWIRAGASVVGAIIWAQFSLGFLSAYLFEGGSASGFFMYSFPCLCELANVYRSWKDISSGAGKR